MAFSCARNGHRLSCSTMIRITKVLYLTQGQFCSLLSQKHKGPPPFCGPHSLIVCSRFVTSRKLLEIPRNNFFHDTRLPDWNVSIHDASLPSLERGDRLKVRKLVNVAEALIGLFCFALVSGQV